VVKQERNKNKPDQRFEVSMTDSITSDNTKFKPRDYQLPIISSIIDHCREKDAKPAFVDISVGGGKTAIYAFVADHVASKGGKVLVLARQGELVEQNSNFAWKAGVDNSVYSASLNKKSQYYNTVYGTEGTIARQICEGGDFGYTIKSDGTTVFNWVPDLIMIDECHMINYADEDNQYMKIIRFFQSANPRLRVIGGTGSPIRDKEYIVGTFWDKRLYELSTDKLVEWSWLVPPIFGFPESEDSTYDFSSITVEKDGDSFSDDQLNAIVLDNPTKTQEIMAEIVERTKDRLGVLVFLSTKKHCAEAAKALPEGSYGVVTDSTGYKERSRIYKAARAGEIKFLLNVGVLSTGYNNPRIDCVVYLRPLDSLTLLIQTLGRGFRIPEDTDNFEKSNCLVLDYGDVMGRLGSLYDNPILETAVAEKAKRKGEVLICPQCQAENSMMARRCIGRDANDNRCEYFYSFRECTDQNTNGLITAKGCGTKNDPCARECRNCRNQLIDPNEKLSRTHYTEKDLVDVVSMKMIPCNNEGVLVKYILANGVEASEFFSPFSSHVVAKRIWKSTFFNEHTLKKNRASLNKLRSSAQLCNSGLFMQPKQITHRINDKNKSVINRRVF